METQNEQKAKELAFKSPQCQMYIDNKCNKNFPCDRFKVALEMAQWKDEQHAQEKQQWIDNACELLFKNTRFTTNDIRDFKKEMKGE